MSVKNLYSGLFALSLIVAIIAVIFFPYREDTSEINTSHLKAPEKQVLTFAHNTPTDSALHEAALRYAALVRQKSNNEITIEVFPSQQLGNDHQMVEMARDGTIDILLTPTAKMSVPVPSMQYADLPFYFPSREDVYAMLDGEPGKMLLNNLNTIDLIGVTFWENGFKHFTGNRPFSKPEDFNGSKIRVMKSRIIMEQFKSFGAHPIPIDFHATKKALADGVVDGQENPLVAIVSMKFYEVQSDFTESEHAYLGYVFSISKKTMEKLPPAHQKILIESAIEVTPWEREQTQKREKMLKQTIADAGLNMHTINAHERKQFSELTAHIPKQYEEVIGSNIISKTEELMFDKYQTSNDNVIVIGIDADLSMGAKVAGLAIKRGAELAANEINANGGVLGKKLVVIARDHRGISNQGIANIKKFSHIPQIAAIVGGLHSAVIFSELDTIKQAGIPYLVPWAAASELTDNTKSDHLVFRNSANDNEAATFIADYALRKYKSPAIFVENSVWGRSNLEKMKEHFRQKGIDVVDTVIFNRGEQHFDPMIKKASAKGADVVIMVANPIEGGAIVESMANEKMPLPIISHWGIAGGDFFKAHQHALESVDLTFFQTFSFIHNNAKMAKKLATAYMNTYDVTNVKNIDAPAGVAQSYDLVMLLALAIEKAGSYEHDKVHAALHNLPFYDGVLKKYTAPFSETDHDALDSQDYFMAIYDSNGTIVKADERRSTQ